MNDKSFIAKMYNSGHSVTRLQGGHGPGDELSSLPVLDDSVIVAVLHVLEWGLSRLTGEGAGEILETLM